MNLTRSTVYLKLTLFVPLIVSVAIYASVFNKLLEVQPMNEEWMTELMEKFVILLPDEVPGFNTLGGIVKRKDTKWGVVGVELLQRLYREEKNKVTVMRIQACLLPVRDIAYQVAVLLTTTQQAPIGEPGMPEGSWSGLPIGEKVWSTVPKQIGEAPVAHLTAWDDRLAVGISIEYQRPSKWVEFVPINHTDLEAGELAARLIIVKANLALLGWREIPKVRLVADGKEMEARKVREGLFLLPVSSLAKGMGWRFERRYGVAKVSFSGREVVLPMGSRELLVGGKRVKLALPVLWDGKELWAEGASLAKGLGFALREKEGKLVLAKR